MTVGPRELQGVQHLTCGEVDRHFPHRDRSSGRPSVCDHDFAGRDLDEPVRRASDHPIVKRRVAHEADDEQIIAATLGELSYCRNRVSHDHMCFQGDTPRFRFYVRVYRDGVEEAGRMSITKV